MRAGISERVAMDISGHRTRSVFDRYDIVSEADIREAQIRMNQIQRTTRENHAALSPQFVDR